MSRPSQAIAVLAIAVLAIPVLAIAVLSHLEQRLRTQVARF